MILFLYPTNIKQNSLLLIFSAKYLKDVYTPYKSLSSEGAIFPCQGYSSWHIISNQYLFCNISTTKYPINPKHIFHHIPFDIFSRLPCIHLGMSSLYDAHADLLCKQLPYQLVMD